MAWNTSDRLSRLPSNWSSEIQPRILRRDNYRCQIKLEGCSVVADEVDHKIRGDNHAESNLQAACSWCHSRKSSKEGNDVKARMRSQKRRPPERHPGSMY